MLRRNSLTKPFHREGGFTYVCPETGVKIVDIYWHRFLPAVLEHRAANKLPIPLGFDFQVEHEWCLAHPDMCKERDPEKMPPILQQAKGLVVEAAKFVASGFSIADDPTYQKRLKICQGCDAWRGERALGYGRCSQCGCSRLKLFLPKSRCPVGKW
jgi:hypothetical protein